MIRSTGIVVHVALIAALAYVGIPVLADTWLQIQSGYVPDWYGEASWLLFLASPLVLAVLVGAALIPWTRGRYRWLILADLIATVAAWTVMLVFLFAGDQMFIVLALTPAALLVAALPAIAAWWWQRQGAPRRD